MLFKILPFMQCVLELFVNVKGVQSFKNKSSDKQSYCLPKEKLK